jgi:hypothetical protein
MSSISAGTSGGTALVSTGDTTGALVIKTGGSATTAATFNADQTVTLAAPLPVASGGTGSTTLSGITTGTATNLAGGSNGTIPYQSAAGTTQMLAVGTAGQLLQTNGVGAPTWATVSVGPFGTDLSYADYFLTLSSAVAASATSVFMQAVSLDGTSELMIIYSSSSAHAVVFNTTTNTFGTPILLRTGNFGAMRTIAPAKISSTAVLVCSLATNTTALETVVLTVSGSTITVGTALATTLAANSSLIAPNTRLVIIGSSYVLNYYTVSNGLPKFRAITVSGSTPSIGAELAYAGGANTNTHHSYAHSSSILLSFSMTDASTVFVLPITVSGTTLTAGTAATVATTDTTFCTASLASSRYALAYADTTGRGAVVSVAGSVASISTAATTMTIGTWSPQLQAFSNQAFILTGSASTDRIAVITDTAGVASIGTPLNPASSTMVGYLSTGKVFTGSLTAGNSSYIQYGISSGEAVVEKTFQNVTSTTVVTAANFSSSAYTQPLSGPPQSGSGATTSLRTSSGKTSVAASVLLPFTISIDGTYPAKLQQSANPFNLNTTFNDGIFESVVWGLPSTNSATATTIQLRKVTLV